MKVNIIGGGMSGLTLGCYLQMYGFETEIVEKNSVPGGLCASWKRGEYTFDGSIRWILGSGKGNAFYKLWSELIDMDELDFITHETCLEIELNNNRNKYEEKVFKLYTNIDRLKAYLLDIAPEDEKQIRKFIFLLRVLQRYELPPMICEISQLQSMRQKSKMISYLPLGHSFLRWGRVTNFEFARKLKNPFLKEAIELLYDGEEVNLLVVAMPLAAYDTKSAGYPVGGSAMFADRFRKRYESLGGVIHFNSQVVRIDVDNGRAAAIELADGRRVESDVTVSAADWHFTVFEALEGRFVDSKINKLANLKSFKLYPSVIMISLGVARSLKEYPHFFRFPLQNCYKSPDGTVYKRLEVHIFNYDPTLAPEGKCVVSMSFFTENGQFWIEKRESEREQYYVLKEQFASNMIDELDRKLGGIKENLEVVDVATPATYLRYTGNWMGSAQGWFPKENLIAKSPVEIHLPGLKDFFYNSQWLIPGGGLPTILKASHDLAQKMRFVFYKERFNKI